MLKQLTVFSSSIAAILLANAVHAMPASTQKINICGNFTANKYGISTDQVAVQIQRRTRSGYFLNWSIKSQRATGYCFVTHNNRTTQWVIELGPRPEQGTTITPGVNEQAFVLPGYGNVIVNRGQEAIGDKQYFLVRLTSTARVLKWYALCGGNSDQVYDENGEYVGFDRKMVVMFPYVCEVSSLSPAVPRPQPR